MELLERRTQTILTDVLSHRSDLGIIYLTASNKARMLDLLSKDGLAFQPFCTAHPHVFLSKKHPLAGEKLLTLDQLSSYPHVQYSYEEDRPLFAEEYMSVSENPREIVTTDRHSLINIVKETDAYTTGSGYMAGEDADDVAVIPLKDGEKEPMLIGWTNLPEQGEYPKDCVNLHTNVR